MNYKLVKSSIKKLKYKIHNLNTSFRLNSLQVFFGNNLNNNFHDNLQNNLQNNLQKKLNLITKSSLLIFSFIVISSCSSSSSNSNDNIYDERLSDSYIGKELLSGINHFENTNKFVYTVYTSLLQNKYQENINSSSRGGFRAVTISRYKNSSSNKESYSYENSISNNDFTGINSINFEYKSGNIDNNFVVNNLIVMDPTKSLNENFQVLINKQKSIIQSKEKSYKINNEDSNNYNNFNNLSEEEIRLLEYTPQQIAKELIRQSNKRFQVAKNLTKKGNNKINYDIVNVVKPYKVGDVIRDLNISFSISNKINATVVYESAHAFYVVDDLSRAQISEEKIKAAADSFEKGRDILINKFCTESDVDHNNKVVIVLAQMNEGLYGYFYQGDKYYKNNIDNIDSNEGDFLYVNSRYFFDSHYLDSTGNIDIMNQENVFSTLLHEFQHMLVFDYRFVQNSFNKDIDVWINEGLSMLSEYITDHSLPHEHYIKSIFTSRKDSLIKWGGATNSYGYSLLFMRYLYDKFGDDFLKRIYNSSGSGVDAIESATGMDFNVLFEDFVKMIFLTGRNVTNDERYNIPDFNCEKNTDCFRRNGFNLANIIDSVYSSKMGLSKMTYNNNSKENQYITVDLDPYTFHITKWINRPEQINLIKTNNSTVHLKSFYEIY